MGDVGKGTRWQRKIKGFSYSRRKYKGLRLVNSLHAYG
jgi:hypothetical protein